MQPTAPASSPPDETLLNSLARQHADQGIALLSSGNPAGAAQAFRRVLAAFPYAPLAWYALGVAGHGVADAAMAETASRHALVLDPSHAEAAANLAAALGMQGRPAEALRPLRRALAQTPASPDGLGNLATATMNLSDWTSADRFGRRALVLRPYDLAVLPSMASVADHRGDYRAAERFLRIATLLEPSRVLLHFNLGATAAHRGEPGLALTRYRRALAIDPHNRPTRWNRAMSVLRLGDFEQGWDDFELRGASAADPAADRGLASARWRGEDLAGKSILVLPEQGYGDELQFVRYLPLLADRGATVHFESPGRLARLFRSLRGDIRVQPPGEPLPATDFHIPLLSLPRLFSTTLATIPAETPYLSATPEAEARWAPRIGALGHGLKVGLVWSGSNDHPQNHHRALKLGKLAPLLDVPGVRFVSLQVGDGREDLSDPALATRLFDIGGEFEDFADAAGALSSLDLIISTDTAVPHLAGALHRPVWIFLHAGSDWRWLDDRSDSPWYPSARLFRQIEAGRWDEPIAAVRAALEDLADRAR